MIVTKVSESRLAMGWKPALTPRAKAEMLARMAAERAAKPAASTLVQIAELWWVEEPKLPTTRNGRCPQLGVRENPMQLPVFRPRALPVVDDVDEVRDAD